MIFLFLKISVMSLMFDIPSGLSILGTKDTCFGILSIKFLRSWDELTFEIAKYRIFLLELRIDTKSSKEYLLFGGFVLPIGKSIKISECLCFFRIEFSSSKKAAAALISNGLNTVLITDGPNTACLASKSEIIELRPPTVKVQKLTGAGDVLMASHIAKILKGENNYQAFKFAIEQTSKFISEDLTNEIN